MQKRKKISLHIHIPQTEIKKDNIEYLYKLFRRKVLNKSADAYVDNGRNPVRLVLNIIKADYDSQPTVVVKYGSFDIIWGEAENKNKEIGFEAIVYSGLFNEQVKLRVFKSGKAYLEKLKKNEKQ